MNRVAVVVLNWNGIEDTEECLSHLAEQSFRDFHIVLIDNGSVEQDTEMKLEAIKAQYGNLITIIRNKENQGFAGGVNIGIRHAFKGEYEFVALLNNDAVPADNWLEKLVESADARGSGITTGLLLHSDGTTIDSTGDWCSVWGLPFPRNRNDPRDHAPKSQKVFSGSGGASLYSTKMLHEIGIFDETFFAYYEDTDVSFRAQLYGWEVYYTNQAVAYHKQGATSGKIPGFAVRQTFKNLPLFYIKNMPAPLLLTTGPRFILAYILMLGNAIKNGNGAPAFKGWLAQIPLFWFHAVPARIKIQRERKVPTSYIRSILWSDLPPDQTGLRKFRSLFTGRK
jgi:GT2 family glycosyltransferase